MEVRKMRLKEMKDTNDIKLYYEYLEANPLDEILVKMYNGDAGGKLKSINERLQKTRRDRTLDLRTRKDLIDAYKLEQDLIKMQLVDLYTAFGVNP